MPKQWSAFFAGVLVLGGVARAACGAEAVSLENATNPGPNKLDEPIAKEFSLDRAVHFLDSAALTWQKERQCFTCHTNYAFLYARPAVNADAPAHREVRKFAEELVATRWVEKGPRWDAEVVATAAAMAFNDAATTSKLHPQTRVALDRMWTLQREDGGWNWLKCGWPPMESDDHYGATLAAIATGVAPEGYAKTNAARQGLDKLRQYLQKNPSPTLHHQAMSLWAATYVDGLLTNAERQSTADRLWSLQKADGGWALATLGDWQRADKGVQNTEHSDGYGTGFVAYVLRRSGAPANDARLQKAVLWLKSNQRESGRWITRSLNKDNHHFISHAGTAFAVMALKACEGS